MMRTLLGIVTLVRWILSLNAMSPMAKTASPLIVLGIFTAPPAPIYPVMVTPNNTELV